MGAHVCLGQGGEQREGEAGVSSQCVSRESMGSVRGSNREYHTHTATPHVGNASSNEISKSVKRKESPFMCYTITVSNSEVFLTC